MKDTLRKLVQRIGYDVREYRPYRDPFNRLRAALERHKVDLVLDVGANIGQFAHLLRNAGYRRRIISFEPLSEAHASLMATSQGDPLWTIAPRCAVGSNEGVVDINIAANSQSSSILNMLDRHLAGAPEAGFLGRESVTMTTLDTFLNGTSDLAGCTIALKIDAQGYEAEVLRGLVKWSEKVQVILAELSLTPLYEGEPGFVELYKTIEDRGYRCVSMEPGFTDPRTWEVLQVDAVFER